MEAFKVYSRVRPLNQRETSIGCGKKAIDIIDNKSISVGDSEYRQTCFQLDGVFHEEYSNEDIFQQAVKPLADNFLNGINSTVFAYGITGAGKSYTMFGSKNEFGDYSDFGIIQLVFQYLFDSAKQDSNIKLGLSYMEIYNQQVFDLLKQKSQNLQILDDPVLGVIVSDLEEILIQNGDIAQAYIELGNQRRVVAETKANQFSSRSHAIVQISMEKILQDVVYTAKFSLVDLAGSQKQTVYNQNKGIRNLEGSNINRSLLTLGNCINLLSQKRKGFIPYRDSKLTRLLKDSLGGNTKTAMIACISPSIITYDQTLNTMKYACRARKIQKNVHQNLKQPKTIEEMKKEICRLRKQIQISKYNDDNKGLFGKDEMLDIIQRLIRNVQNTTILKLNKNQHNLNQKMKEIQLIDQQRSIISSIISKFQQDKPISRLDINKSQNYKTDLRKNENMSLNNTKISKTRNNSKHFIQTRGTIHDSERIIEQETNITHQKPLELIKQLSGSASVSSQLQNLRTKHKQQKRQLNNLIFNYMQNQQNSQFASIQRQNIYQYLLKIEKEKQFINQTQKNILQKICRGEKIFKQNLEPFSIINLDQKRLETQSVCASILHDNSDFSNIKHRKQNNRFMNSLQQIRKMINKINSGCIADRQLNKIERFEQCSMSNEQILEDQ